MSNGLFAMSDLSRAAIDIEEIESWSKAVLKNDGSFVVTSSDGMGDFSSTHVQAKIDQYGPDIVFVDYLQLMQDKRNSSGETDRIRNVSKEIKSMALVNSIPIVTVAAASSHETKEYNQPPQIYECSGSRLAMFDVDLCIALITKKRPDGSKLMECVSRKSRHGPEFDFQIVMDIPNGKFYEELWDADLLEEDHARQDSRV
jgi:hypothetical protein